MDALRTDLERVENLTAELESFAEDLARERQRYFDFFHAASDPFVVTDARGLILEANRAAASFAAARAGTLLGKPIFSLVAPGSRRALRTQIGLFAAGPQSAGSWPTVLRAADGAERAAEAAVRKMESGPKLCWRLRLG